MNYKVRLDETQQIEKEKKKNVKKPIFSSLPDDMKFGLESKFSPLRLGKLAAYCEFHNEHSEGKKNYSAFKQ